LLSQLPLLLALLPRLLHKLLLNTLLKPLPQWPLQTLQLQVELQAL
jgi:hypothetical protein